MSARDDYRDALHYDSSRAEVVVHGMYDELDSLRAEVDRLRAACVVAQEDADRLAAELQKHGWGDMHYSSQGGQEQPVVDALAAHVSAVAAREETP